MTGHNETLRLALSVLETAEPVEKAAAARQLLEHSQPVDDQMLGALWTGPPPRPARPATPRLVSPGEVPRRRLGSLRGRVALLHAVAHIEFNAIDLAVDMALRFTPSIFQAGLDGADFFRNWIAVGADEARHFLMIQDRLRELGAGYGSLPAHDGLWEAAAATSDDPLARLAIAPMVLEARGLDVTPGMIERLNRAGDDTSASILSTIYEEEVAHVACGVRWYEALCRTRRLEPQGEFRRLVKERLTGGLKPPFNHVARNNAGLHPAYYFEAAAAEME